MEVSQIFWAGALGLAIVFLLSRMQAGAQNCFFHPLHRFPGPRIAAISAWYKTWQEVFLGKSWVEVLQELHQKYGDVVRVGPNELHFSKPAAYQDIYNNSNRWDKEYMLYRSFGEDQSSFGYLKYSAAKQRKDVLAPLFSKRSVTDLQSLVIEKMEALCSALAANHLTGTSSDMLYGLRCFTADTILAYCFAKDIKATSAPDFQAPIVVAMDAALASFTVFRNFERVRQIVFSMPGWLTKMSTPPMAGLIDLQELLGAQLDQVLRAPGETLNKASHPIIYHRLLNPDASKTGQFPSRQSLYEEAQALLFGGADSAGNTVAAGLLQVVQSPKMYGRLRDEVHAVWPQLDDSPAYERLEGLPYLTAVIKESLRIAPGVPAPLLRGVPPSGATIDGQRIPPGTVVGMSATFVHTSAEVFKNPSVFDPDRWLQPDAAKLETWLVAFSKGPRSCMGQNLAMCEMYIAFAYLLRRFHIQMDEAHRDWPQWKEAFLPAFSGDHPRAFFEPRRD